MKKIARLAIVIGTAIPLLLVKDRNLLGVWFGHTDRHEAIGRAPKPDAGMPEDAAGREAEAQNIRMARAAQVATPYVNVVYGSPESPTR